MPCHNECFESISLKRRVKNTAGETNVLSQFRLHAFVKYHIFQVVNCSM